MLKYCERTENSAYLTSVLYSEGCVARGGLSEPSDPLHGSTAAIALCVHLSVCHTGVETANANIYQSTQDQNYLEAQ